MRIKVLSVCVESVCIDIVSVYEGVESVCIVYQGSECVLSCGEWVN